MTILMIKFHLVAIPNPPKDVTTNVLSHDTVSVSWTIPDEWNETYLPNYLDYKVRYSESDYIEWKEVC